MHTRTFYIVSLLAAVLAIVMPVVPRTLPSVEYVFIFDISMSMRVTDENGMSRLDAAKQLVEDGLTRLPPSARVSIGAFVGSDIILFLRSHPMHDLIEIRRAMELIRWENAWNTGTRNYVALEKISLMAEEPGTYANDDDVVNFANPINVFYFTDGGGMDRLPILINEETLKKKLRLTVVGMGDYLPSLVPPIKQGDVCLRKFTGECYTSALDEASLKKAVEVFPSARYVRAREYIGKADQLFTKDVLTGSMITIQYDVGHIFMWLALVAFLLMMF